VDRLRLALSSLASLALHLLLLGLSGSWWLAPDPIERLGTGESIVVDLVPGGSAEMVAERVPRFIDGARVATAGDVARYADKEKASRARTAAPPAPPRAAPAVETATSEYPVQVGPGAGFSGTTIPSEVPSDVPSDVDDRPYRGPFRGDTPGFNGRIFGQVSVASSAARENIYGRIHLFKEDAVYRDYTEASLFGYAFRERLGDTAQREFETGRVATPGAYLVVTDLFADGHLSTMSHTVLFAFPRRPPKGAQSLYDVVEEKNGDFRLLGPAGSALVFDGRTGGLRAAGGFVVAPPGESGTPPRVAYHGLHLRLQAVGSNPFLRDRPATVVDADGRECQLSTSDLFSYAGRRESDVFKFLRGRCAGLELPKPAPVLVAKVERKPQPVPKKSERRNEEGLVPFLLRGFR